MIRYLKFMVVTGMLLLVACRDVKETSWDVAVLAPLAETSLGLDNLIADSLLSAEPGEPLHLRFHKTISLFPSDSIFRIPDTSFSDVYSFPLPVNFPPGFQIYNINDLIRFNHGNTRITEMLIEEGTSTLTLKNYLPGKMFLDYAIDKAFLNGTSLSLSGMEIEAGSENNPAIIEKTTNYRGYWLNLKGDNDNQFNRLRIRLNVKLDPDGQTISAPGGKPLAEYKNTFNKLKPYYAKGYLGDQQFESYDSLDFGFLKKFSGHIEPQDFQMNLLVENGIGADFSLQIAELSGLNSHTGIKTSLNHTLTRTPQKISRAANKPNPEEALPYTSSTVSYTINASNSNLSTLIASLPDLFVYKARIQVNPLGDISSGNDFIYSNSNINIRINADVPLKINANDLVFTDTIEVEGLESDALQSIQSGKFTLMAENGFPFEMQTEIALLDGKRKFLNSFLSAQTIQAAPVNNALEVIQTRKSVLTIPYDHLIPQQLKDTRFIVLKARMNTKPDQEFVPLFAHYKLRLQLIGDGIYKIRVR